MGVSMTDYEEKIQEIYKDTNRELIEILKKERRTSLYVQFALIICTLFIALGTMVSSCIINKQWLAYESQFVTISVDTEDGNANYIGESGDILNGIN